jgi:hypothetical protein
MASQMHLPSIVRHLPSIVRRGLMAHAVVTHLPIFFAQGSHRTLSPHAADGLQMHPYDVLPFKVAYPGV